MARDSSGNTVSTYTGDKDLYFSGSGPSPSPATNPTVTNKNGSEVAFGSATTITFASGVANVSGGSNGVMRLFRAGRDTIAVEDRTLLISSGGTDRLIVTITADLLAKFGLTFATPQQSGLAFTGANTIIAQDSYGNPVTNFDASSDNVTVTANALGGTVSGLGSGGNNVLNQFSDFVAGIANVTGKLKYTSPVGATTFTAVNTTSKAGTSNSVQIVAGCNASCDYRRIHHDGRGDPESHHHGAGWIGEYRDLVRRQQVADVFRRGLLSQSGRPRNRDKQLRGSHGLWCGNCNHVHERAATSLEQRILRLLRDRLRSSP
jgi:hypothetical protein